MLCIFKVLKNYWVVLNTSSNKSDSVKGKACIYLQIKKQTRIFYSNVENRWINMKAPHDKIISHSLYEFINFIVKNLEQIPQKKK